MLSHDLAKVLSLDHEIILTDRNNLDISSKENVEQFLSQYELDFVINCAAYTLVDKAEEFSEQNKVEKINSLGVYNLAKYCSYNKIKFIQYSTDYVFDGENKNGYKESDIPINPVNFYGLTKLKAENYISDIANNNPDFVYYIFRISWLYGSGGKNFVDTMIHLSKNKTELSIINDQIGSPTYTLDVAKRTNYIINNNLGKGIYHLSNEGAVSWYEFASEIFRLKNIDIKLNPISSSEYKTLARRPKFSILLNTKLNTKMRIWKEALAEYLGKK